MASYWRQREFYKKVSDAIAVGHFVLCNIILVVGEVTNVFSFFKRDLTGFDIIYRFIDAPVYKVLEHHNALPSDLFFSYVFGESVILVSSLLYWFVVFVLLKAFFAFFD